MAACRSWPDDALGARGFTQNRDWLATDRDRGFTGNRIDRMVAQREQVLAPDYDSLYREFNPALFNAEEWAQLPKDSGFRYVVVVSKHHDGFMMWDTKQTDYHIMHSAFHRGLAEGNCRRLPKTRRYVWGLLLDSGLLSLRLCWRRGASHYM